MKARILQKLAETEFEKEVKILHAVETGSRLWGFASPDSDYDIRFIYKHPADYYLQLWDKRDVIEFMTEDELDGSGWDLQKALKLLAKSNAPLMERLYSQEVYIKHDAFIEQMRLFAKECFSPIATMHHYLGITKSFMEACSGEQVKLKSYFYALRSALACKWIIEQASFPPVVFYDLLPMAKTDVLEKITELLAIKSVQGEKYLHPKENLITDYLLELMAFSEKYALSLDSGKKMATELEMFFREEVKRG